MSNINNWRAHNREISHLINEALLDDDDDNVQFITNAVESLYSESVHFINNSFNSPIEILSDKSSTLHSQDLTNISFENVDPVVEYFLSDELASWAARNKCTRVCINELLEILSKNGHNNLQKNCRTLMKTPRYIQTLTVSGGEYVYLGILNGITKILEMYTGNKLSLKPIFLEVNIDGLPLFKSSSKQFWPILGAFGGMKPFIIALYCGMQKQDPVSEFLKDFLAEFCDLKANGFTFDNLLFKLDLKYFCCDAPARQVKMCQGA
ncbi:uncharacterized protein LOC101238125 [Hydra vulgaris]|uniref:uncharacterized protein LOC101238125 n=1 Tax=Hydra vulgaris TaxID=6087 RepID=UPI0032EA43F6